MEAMATEEPKQPDRAGRRNGPGGPRRPRSRPRSAPGPTAGRRAPAGRRRPGGAERPAPGRRAQPSGPWGDGRVDPPIGGPAARRALRSQGRRTMRRLLDAGMKAIDERGYHATRVQDVVDIANTSHGTFYLYFSNKEDLVRALTMEATVGGHQSRTGHERGRAATSTSMTGTSCANGWSGTRPCGRAMPPSSARGPTSPPSTTASASRSAAWSGPTPTPSPPGWPPRTGPVASTPQVAGLAVIALLDRFHYLREFTGRAPRRRHPRQPDHAHPPGPLPGAGAGTGGARGDGSARRQVLSLSPPPRRPSPPRPGRRRRCPRRSAGPAR